LQREGMITLARGCITLTDREKLESRVCECYRNVRDEYKRLMPGPSGT